MKTILFLASFLFSSLALSAQQQDLPPLKTVPYVDIERYMGKWYEIARFEQRFQKDCVGVTATYSLNENGSVKVLNECRLKTLDGKYKSAEGCAKVADKMTNSKLRVTFFWPFYGDYWVIDLGENYEYAVVGAPNRDYLWILSRTPQMDEQQYAEILQRLQEQHYDISKLMRTLQPENE